MSAYGDEHHIPEVELTLTLIRRVLPPLSHRIYISQLILPRPTCSTHQFSNPPAGPTKSSSSNLPFFFGGAGIVGLATYLYLGGSAASFSTASSPTTKPKPTKSALDPERFLDPKPKAIEPYNHSTSRFVFELHDGGAALSPVTSLVVVRASEGAEGDRSIRRANQSSALKPRSRGRASAPNQEIRDWHTFSCWMCLSLSSR